MLWIPAFAGMTSQKIIASNSHYLLPIYQRYFTYSGLFSGKYSPSFSEIALRTKPTTIQRTKVSSIERITFGKRKRNERNCGLYNIKHGG